MDVSTHSGLDNFRSNHIKDTGIRPFVIGSILLGTIGIFVHEANADPITTTWFRCAFGLIGLTIWFACRHQLKQLSLPSHIRLWVIVSGVLMVTGWGMFFAAIDHVSASVATVLFHVQPFWVLVLNIWWLKESIKRQRVISILLAMVGLVLATGIAEQILLSTSSRNIAFSTNYWLSVGACIFGALCMACVTIIAKKLRDIPAGAIAWWQCAIGATVLITWPFINGWPLFGESWLWLSGLGFIHTGLAYSLIYKGMAKLRVDRIVVYQFIYPAVVILIDWQLYDQPLSSSQIFGVIIMAVALWFAEHTQRSKNK